MSGQNVDLLDHLRAQFARQDHQHDKTRREFHEVADRVGRHETVTAGLRRDIADIYTRVMAVGHQVEALFNRVDRIEPRLELVGTP